VSIKNPFAGGNLRGFGFPKGVFPLDFHSRVAGKIPKLGWAGKARPTQYPARAFYDFPMKFRGQKPRSGGETEIRKILVNDPLDNAHKLYYPVAQLKLWI
jgi:hypothetical protein